MEITYIWIIATGLISILLILSPFFSKGKQRETAVEYSDALQKKEQIFLQLKELEYDFHMDKLSEQDYKKAKAQLTALAAQFVMPEPIDNQSIGDAVDREIAQFLNARLQVRGSEVSHEL